MTERKRNPHLSGSPAWQLLESMISYENSAHAWAEDARRYAEKSQAARETADAYRAAYQKVIGEDLK